MRFHIDRSTLSKLRFSIKKDDYKVYVYGYKKSFEIDPELTSSLKKYEKNEKILLKDVEFINREQQKFYELKRPLIQLELEIEGKETIVFL